MKFTPNPPPVVEDMLKSIGMGALEDLFSDIPDAVKLQRDLNLPTGQSEMEIRAGIKALVERNLTVEKYPCFLGAGVYDHYIPAALEQMLLRSEFYTSYTPYQPEISQGILQSIFEYQTMICQLTGMEASNASVYDGGTALAEACTMAGLSSKVRKILVPDTIHPEYIEILKTYSLSGFTEIVIVPGANGVIDTEKMVDMIDRETAAVVVQQPNFLGFLEDIKPLEEAIHRVRGLLIMAVDPISLALLKSPREWGADIAVGEGQSLGNSLSFGGPYLGFFATNTKLMRKMPGRIVGQTVDQEGNRAYVLTLQAREQHIRREKAGSNICSNQALNALAATMYLTFIGREGLKQVALKSHQLAVYAQNQLQKAGLSLRYQHPYFREFPISINDPAAANQKLLAHGIIGGYELEDAMLLAFTEKRTRSEVDRLVAVLGGKTA